MLPKDYKVNKKFIPIKGHYFFFNAGTAPLVPYLSTYARQLGFSSSTVGLIYTVLPVTGLIAKPLFGLIADRFKILKSVLIIFQIITILSFSFIYFLPNKATVASVGLGCKNDTTIIRSCYKTANLVDRCTVSSLKKNNIPTTCQMNCSKTPEMWQLACEHWHIPEFCTDEAATHSLQYSARLATVTLKDQCAYIAASKVTIDGFTRTPSCRIGDGYVDLNEPCTLICPDPKLNFVFNTHQTNMTCLGDSMYYRLCNSTNFGLKNNDILNSECTVSCNVNKSSPWKFLEICDSWKANDTEACHLRTDMYSSYPENLSLTGNVVLTSTVKEKECVNLQMTYITLPNGKIEYTTCTPLEKNRTDPKFDYTTCEIICDYNLANKLFSEASLSRNDDISQDNKSQDNKMFWLFFTLMIISWIGQAVVVTFADVVCFNLLKDQEAALYGRQRLWGSVGYGIFSLLTGYLIDLFSDGEYKDYTVAFVLMFCFLSGDIAVSCFLKIEPTKMSHNILSEVGTLFSSIPTFVFLLWTIAVGVFTGLVWQFLFWLIEDVAMASCGGASYVKTLQGLVIGVQTFFGEIPFMHKSGSIIKKLGHVQTMNVVLFGFALRFMLYSFLTNAWWVLPIELLQGVTFGMFYPTLTSYANTISPPGTETTVQGLVGAIFEGLGTSLGSFVGGNLYENYGGFNTFRWFSYGALTCGVVHTAVQHVIKNKNKKIEPDKGNNTDDECQQN